MVRPEDVEPPSIQLRFGTALYDGVRGSYCWTPPAQAGAPRTPGLCADVLPPVFETVLAWPAGAPLEFVVGGPEPTTLTLAVYGRPTDPVVLQAELPAGDTVVWEPTLAPGAYVLGVAARWPQGDVIYYFPVGILDDSAPADPAAAPGFEPGDGVVGPAVPVAPTPAAPPPSQAPPAPRPALAPTPVPPPTVSRLPGPTPMPTVAVPPLPDRPPPGGLPEPPVATPTSPRTPTPSATPPAPPPTPAAAGPAITPTPPGATAPGGTAGRVLLRDEFTDTASGFPLESRDATMRRLGYVNGEYLVARLAGSGGAAFVAYPERFTDFQAEIDARLVPPTDDGYVFVDFRRQENGDFYSFLVDPNAGKFLLLRHTGDRDMRLIDWTDASAIRPDTATNRLGVRARGNAISVSVGGTEVGRAQDGALREGWVGFGVGSLGDERAEGRFSRLLVTAAD
jgi:hypothetical protein